MTTFSLLETFLPLASRMFVFCWSFFPSCIVSVVSFLPWIHFAHSPPAFLTFLSKFELSWWSLLLLPLWLPSLVLFLPCLGCLSSSLELLLPVEISHSVVLWCPEGQALSAACVLPGSTPLSEDNTSLVPSTVPQVCSCFPLSLGLQPSPSSDPFLSCLLGCILPLCFHTWCGGFQTYS